MGWISIGGLVPEHPKERVFITIPLNGLKEAVRAAVLFGEQTDSAHLYLSVFSLRVPPYVRPIIFITTRCEFEFR